jgi:hypothetical protein
MLKLPSQRNVNKFIMLWWKRIKTPYYMRHFLEAPRDNLFSKIIRRELKNTRVPFEVEKSIPFRKEGILDKKASR